MSDIRGWFEDADGNKHYSECAASDVEMSDGSTAQDAINNLTTLEAQLLARLNSMNTSFNIILGTSS